MEKIRDDMMDDDSTAAVSHTLITSKHHLPKTFHGLAYAYFLCCIQLLQPFTFKGIISLTFSSSNYISGDMWISPLHPTKEMQFTISYRK